MLRARPLAILFALILGFTLTAAAQGTNAVITGTISDAQGGVLPGVTVTARNIETGVVRTTVSEADGRFRFGALPSGRYGLKAELQGFQTAEVPGVTVTIGQELRQDLSMSLGTLQETVTVTGQAPVVEPTASQVSAVITQ